MLTIGEFETGFISAEGQIRFERTGCLSVDEQAVQKCIAAARRYQHVLIIGGRLADDCNYLLETSKELAPMFSKFLELKGKKGKPGAFREAFKDSPYQEKSTEKPKVEKTQTDNLRFNFNRIVNMFQIKRELKERVDEYRVMTSVIASPASMLSACGLSVFMKDIGATAEESGGNYMLAYSRPQIFGELFPSHNESTKFVEWNRDALAKMDAILTSTQAFQTTSLDILEEIMNIESPMFENFRQDRTDSEKFIDEAIEKAEAEKKKLAEKMNTRNGRPMQTPSRSGSDRDPPIRTRTLDEYNAQPSQPERVTKSSLEDRSKWSQDTTSTYRPPQRRHEHGNDDYVPKSPPPKPLSNNGWQTVSKGRSAWKK